jgi:uncharacterized protein (TIGR03437 family)
MRFVCWTGLGLAVLVLGGSRAVAQTQDDFFDDSFVHEIRLTLKPSDWDLLRKNFDQNTYYTTDVHWIFKGKDLPILDCAIRSRGHGSRSPIKPNLRVDINRNEPDQVFLGLKSFILKANNQDPSMLREIAVFKLWDRLGLPASREAHTRLYVNNVFWGAYLLEEEIRTEYTKRYLNDSDGDLYEWKPLSGTEGWNDGYHWEWAPTCKSSTNVGCSTDPNKWNPQPWNPEENKSTFDLSPTINVHRMATQATDADFDRTLSAMLDLKLFVLHNAIESYVADFDSFLGDAFGVNNVWIYRYKGTNFHQFLLWDKDGSFSVWNKASPYLGADRPLFRNTDANVLMRRTLAIPTHRTEYVESLYKTAVLAGGAGGWLDWEHQRNYDLAGDVIRSDPNKQWGDNGIEKPSNNDLFQSAVDFNRVFIRYRYIFALDELRNNGIQFPSSVFVGAGGVVNAATNVATVTPGGFVSIYGSGFSSGVVSAPGAWPKTLGGVTVFVNGFAAPIQFVSPGQINVQVPWELGLGEGATPFTVMIDGPTAKGTRANSPVNGALTNTVTSRIARYAPGIHQVAQADGTIVANKPAKAGDVLVIYASGLGPVSNQPASGATSPSDNLAICQEIPTVTIGGLPAEVQFAGLAPFFVGAYQVNIKAPAGVPSGNAQMLISSGGEVSNSFPIPIQ